MDILIKNMEMPKNCYECRLHLKIGVKKTNLNMMVCSAIPHEDDGYIPVASHKNDRPFACPLVALPEHHGRLKDIDAIIEELTKSEFSSQTKLAIEVTLLSAPTILEAST